MTAKPTRSQCGVFCQHSKRILDTTSTRFTFQKEFPFLFHYFCLCFCHDSFSPFSLLWLWGSYIEKHYYCLRRALLHRRENSAYARHQQKFKILPGEQTHLNTAVCRVHWFITFRRIWCHGIRPKSLSADDQEGLFLSKKKKTTKTGIALKIGHKRQVQEYSWWNCLS